MIEQNIVLRVLKRVLKRLWRPVKYFFNQWFLVYHKPNASFRESWNWHTRTPLGRECLEWRLMEIFVLVFIGGGYLLLFWLYYAGPWHTAYSKMPEGAFIALAIKTATFYFWVAYEKTIYFLWFLTTMPGRYLRLIPRFIFWSADVLHVQMLNDTHCLKGKYKFLFYLEIYMILTFWVRIYSRKVIAYLYCVLKIITIILPRVWLSTTDRVEFIPVQLLVLAFEIATFSAITWSQGWGKDWEISNRYKRITQNRVDFTEYTLVTHWITKLVWVTGRGCFNDWERAIRRMFPDMSVCATRPIGVKPRNGSIWPDVNSLTSFVELDSVSDLRYSLLLLLALSSLTVYSIILAGWSSNSKYAFIGALRSAAQMISYEVAISLIFLPVVLLSGSLNISKIVFAQSFTIWFLFPLFPISLIFLVAMLAETNRTPFDLPEAEAELVAGYNVDYSSLPFAMFFLAEYSNMILMAVLWCSCFASGALVAATPLIIACKAAFLWYFFVLVRATLPRYRYDQLMEIGWKIFLLVAGAYFLYSCGTLVAYDALPVVNELATPGRSSAV